MTRLDHSVSSKPTRRTVLRKSRNTVFAGGPGPLSKAKFRRDRRSRMLTFVQIQQINALAKHLTEITGTLDRDGALAWIRNTKLPGFGQLTPFALIRQNRAKEIYDTLDAIRSGAHY